jgi:hypothetical protein
MMSEAITPSWAAPLHGERGKAWAAFVTFRDLGPSRTIDGAYRASRGHEAGAIRAPRRWKTWAAAFAWQDRVRAFDVDQDRLRREAEDRVIAEKAAERARQREEWRARELDLAHRLVDRAVLMLTWPAKETVIRNEDGSTTVIRPARWSLRDAAVFVATADKLARLALEMETERTKSEHTGKDGGPLVDEGAASLTERELRQILDYANRRERNEEEF